MQDRYILSVRQAGEARSIPLRNTNAKTTVNIQGEILAFETPDDSHTYFSSKDNNSFAVVPERSALQIIPNRPYRLHGQASFEGLGRAQLYLIEYSATEKLATHSVPLEQGPFELQWSSHPEAKSCCVAIRLSGDGKLAVPSCQFVQDQPAENLADALKRLDGPSPRRRIFITGCPRSGTTMMLNMMRCFRSVYVDIVERPFRHFALIDADEPTIVLKRTGDCWRNSHEIPPSIDVIYMARHPLDVLTSKHPLDKKRFFVDIDYWLNEFNAYKRLAQSRTEQGKCILIRYEDIVREPIAVQRRLQKTWGFELEDAEIGFDKFHLVSASDKTSRFQAAMGKIRPPDTASVGKWLNDAQKREHLLGILETHAEEIREFLDIFGYPLDDIVADATARQQS